jgi:hypothetical protein
MPSQMQHIFYEKVVLQAPKIAFQIKSAEKAAIRKGKRPFLAI